MRRKLVKKAINPEWKAIAYYRAENKNGNCNNSGSGNTNGNCKCNGC